MNIRRCMGGCVKCGTSKIVSASFGHDPLCFLSYGNLLAHSVHTILDNAATSNLSNHPDVSVTVIWHFVENMLTIELKMWQVITSLQSERYCSRNCFALSWFSLILMAFLLSFNSTWRSLSRRKRWIVQHSTKEKRITWWHWSMRDLKNTSYMTW